MTRRMILWALVLGFAGPAGAKPATIVVTAKLTGITEAPRCGILHTASVMRYEVKKVESGSYAAPLVYAIFDCGWVDGKPHGVTLGDVHRLTLTAVPKGFEGSVFDDFTQDKTPRLLAVHAD
jgi:hypothetical protein